MSKPANNRKQDDGERRVMISGAGFIVSVMIIVFIGLNPALRYTLSLLVGVLITALIGGFGFVFGLFFILSIIAKYKTGRRR